MTARRISVEMVDDVLVYAYASRIGLAVIQAFEEHLKEVNPSLYAKWVRDNPSTLRGGAK